MRPPTAAAYFVLSGMTVFACVSVYAESNSASPADGIAFFESRIRPVLIESCYGCHGVKAATIEGGLRLDSRAGMLAGGDQGPALVPGQPENSRLLAAIRYADDDLQMPPAGPLPPAVVDDFTRWIALGAPAPRDNGPPATGGTILQRAQRHWAFTPPQAIDPPTLRDDTWAREELDQFVLSDFVRQGLRPAPTATARTLLRRVHYVLTGLPPTAEDFREFIADPSDTAYAAIVDRLLASPHFGERWGRHWLDLARYGDTKGYVFEEDRNYPQAYKYRDWVIAALNRDLPYNQFLSLQLAADQIVDKSHRDDLAAQGYVTLGRRFINNPHDIIDDRIDVVFRGMMGLTVSCARCHDHKYDPISTRDYYGLYGVFASCEERQDEDLPLRLVDTAEPHDAAVFRRGNPHERGPLAPRRFPVFFSRASSTPFTEGSGRLALAAAITDRNNPLTARVFVNRAWSHVFGEPLVATTSDFGLRSDPPTNPELLDHLAVTFMDDGWSIKRLLRRMVLSSSFRQSSHAATSTVRRRRLDLEAMRDALLTVAGCLDRSVGGPSFDIEATPAVTRRTLYAHIDRQNLPGQFRTFDFANPDNHAARRPDTTVPQQALYLMNSPFLQEMAMRTEGRVDSTRSCEERIRAVYGMVYGRDATDEELGWGQAFLDRGSREDVPVLSPWEFGYGHSDESSPSVFTQLRHFTGTQWQEAEELPGAALGWVMLNEAGGHPGGDPQHAAIRRWTAPQAGRLTIRGQLHHPAEQGDGVRARIVSDRQGLLGEWVAAHVAVPTMVEVDAIAEGEVIDFVVDCREHEESDSFVWDPVLTITLSTGFGRESVWDTRDGFHGPLKPMTRWEQFVQALLMSNEFHFVD